MSVDRTEAIKVIQTLYGLQEAEAEKKLQTLSDAEISKLISNYKKDLDMGVTLQKEEKSSVFLSDYDNQTYTDNDGNTITEYFDGENVVERIIKGKDGSETTVTYRDNKPFTQTKNINGSIEKNKFTYHDGEDPFVTVNTTKADGTKVKTNTYAITQNGDVLDDYVKDKKTVKPDGTTITLTPKIIDLKNPLNEKKTFFKGECMEELTKTYSGKKKTVYYEGTNFQNFGRRILAQTSDNTVYYNTDNKPVYNHREYVKKEQEKALKAEYEKRLERNIPLKGSHTNVLNSNNVTIGKAKNITVKEFITDILGIDINSETGKKLADRFVRLSDDALQKISYADFEAQTLGTGKFAPKTNDYSNASFEKIARDLRQKSGVNIETQEEVTQHKIRMQVEERALQNRRQELGIDANNFAKESLAAVYEQAAGMLLQDRNRKMNPLDPKDYAHAAKHLGTAFLDNASMGLLGKDAFHQASDYEDFAQKLRNLPADSPEEFAREYEKLTGQKYDVEKVKGFMQFLNKSNLDKMDDNKRAEFLKSDKYKSEFAKAFGFRATENTEKQLSNENTVEELAGIVGDVYLLAQTGGLSSMKTLVSGSGKLTGKLLSKTALNPKAAGVVSETVARMTGGAVSMAGLTAMKSVSGNIVYDEVDATDFDTWKNTAIGIGESGVLGAVGGVVGKMAEPVVKYIEKPAEREAQAMLKAFSGKGEMSAKELMQTVSKESGISLDGLFKMNKQELINLARTVSGKTVEVSAEALAYGATEAAMDESDKSFTERMEEQYEMLTKMKGASKLVQMVMAGKAGKAALINSSKVLNETRVKPTKTPDGKTQYELTLPNGKTIITENPEHALATCNYLMQAELVEQTAKEEKTENSINTQNDTYNNLLSEADNAVSFEEINAVRKKISQAKLEDKSEQKTLFAKLKAKEQDLRENSVLLKLGTKAGDDIDKHNKIKEFTRNSNVTTAIISTRTNNIIQFFEIKISTDEQGNIVSKTKTELKGYKPKPQKSERTEFDYSYGYSEDRTAYDGGMSESAFDAFRKRMYPDLFGTYEVKDKVVKGERNPVYKSLEHLETGNSRKPINLAPLGENSVRGRNLLTLSYNIFREAKEKGIKRLIDLRAEARDEERIKEVDGKKYIDGVEYVHIPMDYSAGECDPELIRNMSEFFDAMDKGNVYIGCNLGSHRTDFAIALNYALNTKTKEASPMLYLNMSDIVIGVHRVYKKVMKMTLEDRKANNVPDDLINILPKDMAELDKRLKRIADVTQEAK